MKVLFLLLTIFISFMSYAQPLLLGCTKNELVCECTYQEFVRIDSDSPGSGRTEITHRSCTNAERNRNYFDQWGNPYRSGAANSDQSYNFKPDTSTYGPFGQLLVQELPGLFSKHQNSFLQNYLDRLRNWAPIDQQMIKDVENYRRTQQASTAEQERINKETYEYLKEIIKLSQDLQASTKIPLHERPTPVPKDIDQDEIRRKYSDLSKLAQENRPVELNRNLNEILKGLRFNTSEERAFHLNELKRRFLNEDLTFKSLPYVKNPQIKFSSRPTSPDGLIQRMRVNELMAAQSETMRNLHGHCNVNECENIEEGLKDNQRQLKQLYRNIEALDKVKEYSVDSQTFENESKALLKDYTSKLQNVKNQSELNQLITNSQEKFNQIQDERIGVKSRALNEWGGDTKLSDSAVNGLSKTSSSLIAHAKTLNDQHQSAYFRDLAEDALDLALDFTPGVSTVKDLTELITGKSLLKGEELDVTSRSILAVGVVVDVATAGVGGKLTKLTLDKSISAVRAFIHSDISTDFTKQAIKNWDGVENVANSIIFKIDELNFTNPTVAKRYAHLHRAMETAPSNLKILRAKEGIDPSKVAIIGRKMENGVNIVAKHFEESGVKVEIFHWTEIAEEEFEEEAIKWGGRIPYEEVIKTKAYAENKIWSERIHQQGYTVFDIGDPSGADIAEGFSAFYDMEKMTFWGDIKP